MYEIFYTGQFQRDLKRIKKRSPSDFDSLRNIVKLIEKGGRAAIPQKHKTHSLIGNYSKHWECHVLPDLLLIWLQNDSEKTVKLVRVGSHADLFG